MSLDAGICFYCEEKYGPWECGTCKKNTRTCRDCHNEIKHGVIKNQNVHIIGSGAPPGTDTVDGDPDAWAPSWKVGN